MLGEFNDWKFAFSKELCSIIRDYKSSHYP